MSETVAVKDAIKIRAEMEAYQDKVYMEEIQKLNQNCQALLKSDLGSEFILNCKNDLAGEIVRNYFNTSDYYITVDQMAKRIITFTYKDEYDPLKNHGCDESIRKNVYNHKELSSKEMKDIMDSIENTQETLFGPRKDDKGDVKARKQYRAEMADENDDLYDALTGQKDEKVEYPKKTVSSLAADHIQSRAGATYNSRYVTEKGKEDLQDFYNSGDNFQLINNVANSSKKDVRVIKDGKDITYRATPEELADAVIERWEKVDETREHKNNPKITKLKEKGYLDENGKVPPSVRKALIKNIEHSENIESTVILENLDIGNLAVDSLNYTKQSIGKIIAGQIIYYAAPPLVYEAKIILRNRDITLDNALDKLGAAAVRIGNYIVDKLKDIFTNIVFNSLKQFVKSFMDILVNLIKATVKKIMKIAKELILSTVDAVKVIADKNATSSEKANAVFNLYGVTITSCVVEVLFEILHSSITIPAPFDDIMFGPLQILATVVCTNFTMLILKKLDLFDVQRGFKQQQIQTLFDNTRKAYKEEWALAEDYADEQTAQIVEQAQLETRQIYDNLCRLGYDYDNTKSTFEAVNSMFSMGIDFDERWRQYFG